MRARVLVHGWYGNGNLGDEALLEAVLELLEAHEPRPIRLVTSANPRGTRHEQPGVIPLYTRTRFERSIWKAGALLSSAVLVGGGNLLQEYAEGESTVAELLGRLEWAIERGSRAALLGVGVGERLSEAGLAALRRVGPRLAAIIVRDAASANRLADLGLEARVEVACDLGLWWASRRSGTPPRGGPSTLLVNLKGPLPTSAEIARERWELDLLEGPLADAIRRGQRVVGIPARRTEGPDSDWHSLMKLRERLGPGFVVLDRPPSPREYLEHCGAATAVVSGRLHASILAIGAGVPAFGLAYSSKVSDFFHDAGLGALCALPGYASASSALEAFLARPQEARPKIREYLTRILSVSETVYRNAVESCLLHSERA